MERSTTVALWLLLAGLSFWYVKVNLVDQLPGIADSLSDFTHYYQEARQVLAAKSPYADPEDVYPPAVAFALSPLAVFDYLTARRIWFALSEIFLLLAAWATWRAMGASLGAACCVAGVWALGGAAGESLGLGQIGPLLVLLLACAYAGRGAPQGLAAGAGASLKLIPGLLAVVMLLRRDWRACAALSCAMLVAMAIPAAIVAHWDPRQAGPAHPAYVMGTPALLSWSMPSVVLRALDPPRRGPALPHDWEFGNSTQTLELPRARRLVSMAVAAAVLLAGVAALGARCRGRLNAKQAPWASAALISLGLAASPVSWTHYQLLQYPGVVMLAWTAIQRRRWLLAVSTAILGALLYPLPVAILRAYFERYGTWTAWSPATLYIWTSVTPLAALALFAVLLAQIRPESPATPKR